MVTNNVKIIDILNNRRNLIQLLHQGENTQNCLANQTNISQSTVSRTLSQLQDLNIVKRSNNEYSLTLFGEIVIQKYDSWESDMNNLYLASDILNGLPTDISLDPAVLNEAQVTTAEPHSPDSPLLPVIDTIKKSNYITGFSNSTHISISKSLNDKMEDGLCIEFILTEAVAKQAIKKYNTWDSNNLQSDQATLYLIDRILPFNLLIAHTERETYTNIIVCDQTKIVGSILTNDTAANEWAQNIYQQFKSNADIWEPSFSD